MTKTSWLGFVSKVQRSRSQHDQILSETRFLWYLQYLLMDFCQTFLVGAFCWVGLIVFSLPVGASVSQSWNIFISTRACLDQHLIAIRSPGIHGDHVRSKQAWLWSLHHSAKSLSRLRSQSSAIQYKLGLTGHLETVIYCKVMHATWRGGWEMSQHQQPVVHCGGDPGVSECTAQ